MGSLRELQCSFAAALRDPAGNCAVHPHDNLDIYRNNAACAFRSALEADFPVLRRRVGEEYFRQLAHYYREQFPSRSGDLHWVGREFAEFLARHLAGGDYEWLSDLARLEWARACAALEDAAPPIAAEALASFRPDELEHLAFTLQPSLRLIESPYPVFSVWMANRDENAPPLDQSMASECGLARARADGVEIARLAPDLFSYLSALATGATLGQAWTRAALDEARLTAVLRHLFAEDLVVAVRLQPPHSGIGS
jgi:hypothetical protein